ncbi:MAG TPA: hypothetical protein DHV42_02485, partial [Lachnospiraceae bacterium]|nr:hypothetical protein [Lachnospiraceae bacterium]
QQAGSLQAPEGDLTPFQWYIENESPSAFSTPAAPQNSGYSLNIPGWNTGEENASGTVCIMDTGLDTTHPDLENVLYTFTQEQQEKYGCGPHGVNVNTRQLLEDVLSADELSTEEEISAEGEPSTETEGFAEGEPSTETEVSAEAETFTEAEFSTKAEPFTEAELSTEAETSREAESLPDEEAYRKDVTDHFMHGTHIAGIIGAQWDGVGVSGIAHGVKLLSVRLCEDDGMGQGQTDILKGFEWLCKVALETNLKVVNVSLGSMKPQLIHSVMANRLGELGVNVVYASGNADTDLDETIDMGGQNNSPYVVVVNAADMDGKKTVFSCYGQKSTDVFAPGAQILSTVPGELRKFSNTGNLMGTEIRTRFFPEVTPEKHLMEGSLEKFPEEKPGVRFFDQCPVGTDGKPNPDAKEIGSLSAETGFDDEHCWEVPLSAFQSYDDQETSVWMNDGYAAAKGMWLAIPVGEGGTEKWVTLKSSLGDGSHVNAGLNAVLCESKEADGSLVPAVIDMRYDNALSLQDLSDLEIMPGIGTMASMGVSGAQWSEHCIDLEQMVREAAYMHTLDQSQRDEIGYDLTDPGQVEDVYEWEDGGRKYILLEYCVAKDNYGKAATESGSTVFYFDNIAAGDTQAWNGAYESLNGTSMAAPCAAAILAMIAKDEPANADLTLDERKALAIERKAKLLAAVDYDEDLAKLCSTGGRLNLHGKADFTRKAPIISRAIVKDGTLTLSGYFFGTDGELYIDDNPVAAKTWNDQEVTAQVSGLPNGMHTAKIINADAARFTTVFSSSMKTEGRRLYENAYALPLGEEKWIQDKADGIFGMTAADGFLYAMAVYGNEQAQALWRMNLETQAWERCSDLPDVLKGRTMENSGLAAYRGKLYCYTAREGLYSRTPSLCSYDPETDLWEEISLDGLAKSGQIFVLQDTLFLVSDQEKAGSFFRIDPDAGTVDPVSGSLPEISGFYTAVLAPGGDALYLYGSGGYDDNFEEIMKLYRFTWDGQTETFSTQDLSNALAAIGPIDLNQC